MREARAQSGERGSADHVLRLVLLRFGLGPRELVLKVTQHLLALRVRADSLTLVLLYLPLRVGD
jgi:hypothetical protein